MLLNPVLLESLLRQEEGPALDFKGYQYKFDKASDEEKGELLKDILAFANAKRDATAYILIGVKEIKGGRSEIVGVKEQLDDARLHQFVNKKTQRPVEFSYSSHTIGSDKIGVIEIPVQERLLYLTKSYGRLHENVVYIRDGSSTRSAAPDEVVEMSAPKQPQLSLAWAAPDSGEVLPTPCPVSSLIYDPLLPDDTFPQPSTFWTLINTNSINQNYSQELIAFTSDRALYKPFGLRLHNKSGVVAKRVRFLGWMTKSGGLSVRRALNHLPIKIHDPMKGPLAFTESSYPLPASRFYYGEEIDLQEHEDSWSFIVDFGDIRPGEEAWTGNPLWLGSQISQTARLEGKFLGENISDPIKCFLEIRFETEFRPMKKEDVHFHKRDYVEANWPGYTIDSNDNMSELQ